MNINDGVSPDLEPIDNYHQFDVIDEQYNLPRFSNMYIRNIKNPFIYYYHNAEFKNRYRFSKASIRNVIILALGK